jgi:peptidoglycan/LPS O-acetylase OafA/YrhL
MKTRTGRSVGTGAAIAVVASLLLTVVAASLESSINGPGTRNIAPPVLWGLGGGAGLVLGAVVAAFLARRAWPGVVAALIGAVAFLVLLVLGYNSGDLKASDQIVGSLIVLVLPAILAAAFFATVTAFAARLVTGELRQRKSAIS